MPTWYLDHDEDQVTAGRSAAKPAKVAGSETLFEGQLFFRRRGVSDSQWDAKTFDLRRIADFQPVFRCVSVGGKTLSSSDSLTVEAEQGRKTTALPSYHPPIIAPHLMFATAI